MEVFCEKIPCENRSLRRYRVRVVPYKNSAITCAPGVVVLLVRSSSESSSVALRARGSRLQLMAVLPAYKGNVSVLMPQKEANNMFGGYSYLQYHRL